MLVGVVPFGVMAMMWSWCKARRKSARNESPGCCDGVDGVLAPSNGILGGRESELLAAGVGFAPAINQ
jgi:hypothetical protein